MSDRQRVVQFMLDQVGERYRLGAHGPDDWDCSNLTSAAYASVGVSISPGSQQQWREVMDRRIPVANIEPGDLVYWGTPGNATHAGIYVGDWQVVNALNPQRGVVKTPLNGNYGTPLLGVASILGPSESSPSSMPPPSEPSNSEPPPKAQRRKNRRRRLEQRP